MTQIPQTITKFDKTVCRALGLDIAAALADVAKKYGVAIDYGGGSFDNTEFTAKLRVKIADPAITGAEERRHFETACRLFNVPADAYGREFLAPSPKDGKVALIGFSLNRPKFPIRCRKADGTIVLYQERILDRWFPGRVDASTITPATVRGNGP